MIENLFYHVGILLEVDSKSKSKSYSVLVLKSNQDEDEEEAETGLPQSEERKLYRFLNLANRGSTRPPHGGGLDHEVLQVRFLHLYPLILITFEKKTCHWTLKFGVP